MPRTAAAAPRFLDSNVVLRYFERSDPDKSDRARQLLERVERGEEKVATSALVVFEVVFTLQRTYGVPKASVRDMMRDLLSLPALQLPRKDLCLDALDLYVEKNGSFADAYTAVYMRSRGVTEIYSWDSDFDRFEDVSRIAPPA